jgi:hypothetical protein
MICLKDKNCYCNDYGIYYIAFYKYKIIYNAGINIFSNIGLI